MQKNVSSARNLEENVRVGDSLEEMSASIHDTASAHMLPTEVIKVG
jgi:hypothetical protein